MKITDILQETYTALTANKVRTGLTMLGIIIGIGSVIAMVAIGQGAQNSIQSSIQSIGSNLILVTPGAQRSPGYQVTTSRGSARTLTRADADAVAKEITLAKATAPEISGRYQVVAKGANTNTTVTGVTSSYADVRNIQIDVGSFISDENVKSLSKVAVIGPTTRDDLFGSDSDPIGQVIRIKGIQFRIIGMTKSKGGTGFGNQDDVIFIPLSSASSFLAGGDYVTTISLQAMSADSMTELQQEVTELLLARHRISDPAQADFSAINQADIVATASSITGTFTILLAAIAAISLVVGGIGIMNMMLTTVTERTREIGLRKAIGARRRDISIQFLIEAIALTFIGGFLGTVIGWTVAFSLTALGILETSVSVSSVLVAFGVSAAIGIIFGYYPARRAAHLSPIDALRYE